MKLDLTDDQAKDLISLIEGWLPSAEWWVNEYPSKRAYADQHPEKTDLRYHTDRKWNPERYEQLKSTIAFRRRLLTTLAKAKTQANS